MSFVRRHAIKLAMSAAITIGVVYTAARGNLKLVPDGGDFGAVRWWAIPAYIPFFVGLTWFRCVRWRYLLRSVVEVPRMRLLAVSSVGFAAIVLLPFRLGEFVRPYMLRTRAEDRRPGEPVLTMTTATGSIVAERVLDGVFLGVVLAGVLLAVPTVQPLPDKVMDLPISVAAVRTTGFVVLAAFVVALVTIAVFYFARTFAHRATLAVFGLVSRPLGEKLAAFAEKLADGFHVLARGRDAMGFLVDTIGYWLCNALGMWVLAIGCGVVHADGSAITFAEACGLMGMLGCAILIPGPPGLLGVFQAGIYAGMAMYVPMTIVSGPGAAYVFLLYITQLALLLVFGAWGLWHEGGTRRLKGALAEPEVPLLDSAR